MITGKMPKRQPHYMYLRSESVNNVYKTLSIFRPFQNKSTMAGNKRIMSRFPQVSVRQLNTSFTPTSPIKPTPPTLPNFSIQRPVASHSDAKRNATGRRMRRDWQPNALQRVSRCGKNSFSPSGEWRHIALNIEACIVSAFYFKRKQSVKSVTLLLHRPTDGGYRNVSRRNG